MSETDSGTDTAPARLSPGDPAPDFTLPDADGNQIALVGVPRPSGDRVLLPGRADPGLHDAGGRLHRGGGRPGRGRAGHHRHLPRRAREAPAFREKEKLGITLVSDPDKKVLKAYGAFGPKKLYGKEVVGVIRSTFIVDADGAIERASYNVKATGHVAKLRRDLGLG